jgi:hypothetical protein
MINLLKENNDQEEILIKNDVTIERDPKDIINRLKFFLKNNNISQETFSEKCLNIGKTRIRNILANKLQWDLISQENRKIYIKIDKWLNDDKNLLIFINENLKNKSAKVFSNSPCSSAREISSDIHEGKSFIFCTTIK